SCGGEGENARKDAVNLARERCSGNSFPRPPASKTLALPKTAPRWLWSQLPHPRVLGRNRPGGGEGQNGDSATMNPTREEPLFALVLGKPAWKRGAAVSPPSGHNFQRSPFTRFGFGERLDALIQRGQRATSADRQAEQVG